MGFGQGTAEDGKILAEDEDQPPVDSAEAGDDAVAGDGLLGHAEIGRPVFDEHVPFLERARIEQQLEALPGRQLALGVLGVDALLAAALAGTFALFLQLADDVLHGAPGW